jgi:hypothetical protein
MQGAAVPPVLPKGILRALTFAGIFGGVGIASIIRSWKNERSKHYLFWMRFDSFATKYLILFR